MSRTCWLSIALAAVVAGGTHPGNNALAAENGGKRVIAVLVSHNGLPFEQAMEGFRKHLDDREVAARYVVYRLGGNPTKAAWAVREAKRENPDLLLTLGSLATDAARKEMPDVPTVTGMILRPGTLRRDGTLTGVYIEFPPETQFRWLRRILPDVRTVGVLYNPSENRERIRAAAQVAREMGLHLATWEVSSPEGLPAALTNLARKADVLWAFPDGVTLTPETARHILLFSFRNRIPVVAPSAAWVKAGALYGLERDYADMGDQCGEAALRILKGTPAGAIAFAPPRKITYVLNVNTARQLGIDLPEPLVRGAAQVFPGGN